MYTLIHLLSIRQLCLEQLPALGISLLIAEAFYKFHSFTLECLAFLGTWYLLDLVSNRLIGMGRNITRKISQHYYHE